MKVAVASDDSNVKMIESEIQILQLLKGKQLTLNYYACTYDTSGDGDQQLHRYFIILEKRTEHLFTDPMIARFKGFRSYERMFKFVQIAIAIQSFHTTGYSHQDINPQTIMSIDDQMSDVYLFDFGCSVKAGEPVFGGNKLFASPDKLTEGSTASFHHDAYALAITIIYLLDTDFKFFPMIKGECPETMRSLSPGCQKSIKSGLDTVRNYVDEKQILDFIKPRLFSKEEPLDMSKLITELLRILKTVIKGQPRDFAEMKAELERIEARYEANLEAIKNLGASPAEAENKII